MSESEFTNSWSDLLRDYIRYFKECIHKKLCFETSKPPIPPTQEQPITEKCSLDKIQGANEVPPLPAENEITPETMEEVTCPIQSANESKKENKATSISPSMVSPPKMPEKTEILEDQIRVYKEQTEKSKKEIKNLKQQPIDLQNNQKKTNHSLNTAQEQTNKDKAQIEQLNLKIDELTNERKERNKTLETTKEQAIKNTEIINKHQNEAIYYLTKYDNFIESETSFLKLLDGTEQKVLELYLYCNTRKLKQETDYLANILGKYILSKPQEELSRWKGILYNMQYSGLIVDPVKNSLIAENDPKHRIQILEKTIFDSLHREYLNAILLLVEYTLQLKSADDQIKQKIHELRNTLNIIKNKSIINLNININYVSLNQKLEDDTHFNGVEIKEIDKQVGVPSESNRVAEILKYGINYGNNNHEKTIVQCYAQH